MSKHLYIQPRAFMPAYGLSASLEDLLKLNSDDEVLAETFREKHCLVCRNNCDLPPGDRAQACHEAGCSLRDPEHLSQERAFLLYILQVLWYPNLARQELIDLFNNYLLTTRTQRVPLLGTYATGRHGLVLYNQTFRATVQQAALSILAYRAGDRHMNIAGEPQSVLTKRVIDWRREYRDDVKRIVAQMRGVNEPLSWAKIRRVLGPDAPDESTLKDWYKEATSQPPNARRRKN